MLNYEWLNTYILKLLGSGGANLPTDDAAYDQTFAGKIITDLIVNYGFCDTFSANLSVNNLLNVYPDEIDTKGDFVTDLGGVLDILGK